MVHLRAKPEAELRVRAVLREASPHGFNPKSAQTVHRRTVVVPGDEGFAQHCETIAALSGHGCACYMNLGSP